MTPKSKMANRNVKFNLNKLNNKISQDYYINKKDRIFTLPYI